MTVVRVAGIAGSLRAGSYNAALLREAVRRVPDGLEIWTVDIRGFPVFDQDLEMTAFPEAVAEAKEVVRRSDAVLFAAPEYNHGIPGPLKNAIDWMSRPHDDDVFVGKPAAFMGASQGYMGTIRSQLALRQMWYYFDAPVFAGRELTVAYAPRVFEDGKLVDDFYAEELERFLEAIREWLLALGGRE